MPRHRFARFTLWIMAALVAALMAFGPTAAAAHPDHEHRRHVATVEAPSIATSFDTGMVAFSSSPVKAKALSSSIFNARFSAPTESRDEHGSCGGACCSGSGCCASACLTSHARLLPGQIAMAIRQPMPQGRAPNGVDPVALLRPPRLFT